MKDLTIETVKKYNERQDSACMMFFTTNGELRKRGFVVSFDGYGKYVNTKKEASQITEKDFEKNTPHYWNDAGMSNESYINQ